MPEPLALSVTSAVKVSVLPATPEAGPATEPVGLTMSGIVLSWFVTTSPPLRPPTAPTLAFATSTARQSLVAIAPSAGWA